MAKDERPTGKERRKYKRIKKNFMLSYYELDKPEETFEVTQLKNVSMGGMCFVTTKAVKPNTVLAIKLKTPYLTDTTHIHAITLQSHERVKGTIYDTRVQFQELAPEAKVVLSKFLNFYLSGESKDHE